MPAAVTHHRSVCRFSSVYFCLQLESSEGLQKLPLPVSHPPMISLFLSVAWVLEFLHGPQVVLVFRQVLKSLVYTRTPQFWLESFKRPLNPSGWAPLIVPAGDF